LPLEQPTCVFTVVDHAMGLPHEAAGRPSRDGRAAVAGSEVGGFARDVGGRDYGIAGGGKGQPEPWAPRHQVTESLLLNGGHHRAAGEDGLGNNTINVLRDALPPLSRPAVPQPSHPRGGDNERTAAPLRLPAVDVPKAREPTIAGEDIRAAHRCNENETAARRVVKEPVSFLHVAAGQARPSPRLLQPAPGPLPCDVQERIKATYRQRVPRPPPPITRPLYAQPALPSPKNARAEAISSLNKLVNAFADRADCSQLLSSYYRGAAPAHGAVLADWLAVQPQHAFVWGRMHHRVRWRSCRRHFSLLAFVEEQVPACGHAGRLITYVKGWMAELDGQEAPQYKSTWLRTKSNRGNFARFFRQASNCSLMAQWLEEVLAERGLAAEANRVLSRLENRLGELRDRAAVAPAPAPTSPESPPAGHLPLSEL
jgi:hypothetical protein